MVGEKRLWWVTHIYYTQRNPIIRVMPVRANSDPSLSSYRYHRVLKSIRLNLLSEHKMARRSKLTRL